MAIIVSVPTSRAGKYGEMVGDAMGAFVEGKMEGERRKRQQDRQDAQDARLEEQHEWQRRAHGDKEFEAATKRWLENPVGDPPRRDQFPGVGKTPAPGAPSVSTADYGGPDSPPGLSGPMAPLPPLEQARRLGGDAGVLAEEFRGRLGLHGRTIQPSQAQSIEQAGRLRALGTPEALRRAGELEDSVAGFFLEEMVGGLDSIYADLPEDDPVRINLEREVAEFRSRPDSRYETGHGMAAIDGLNRFEADLRRRKNRELRRADTWADVFGRQEVVEYQRQLESLQSELSAGAADFEGKVSLTPAQELQLKRVTAEINQFERLKESSRLYGQMFPNEAWQEISASSLDRDQIVSLAARQGLVLQPTGDGAMQPGDVRLVRPDGAAEAAETADAAPVMVPDHLDDEQLKYSALLRKEAEPLGFWQREGRDARTALQEAANVYWAAMDEQGDEGYARSQAAYELLSFGITPESVMNAGDLAGIGKDWPQILADRGPGKERAIKMGPRDSLWAEFGAGGLEDEIDNALKRRLAGEKGGIAKVKRREMREWVNTEEGAQAVYNSLALFNEGDGMIDFDDMGYASDEAIDLFLDAKAEGMALPVFVSPHYTNQDELRAQAEGLGYAVVPKRVMEGRTAKERLDMWKSHVADRKEEGRAKKRAQKGTTTEFERWLKPDRRSEAEDFLGIAQQEGESDAKYVSRIKAAIKANEKGEPYLRDVEQAAKPLSGERREQFEADQAARSMAAAGQQAAQKAGAEESQRGTAAVRRGAEQQIAEPTGENLFADMPMEPMAGDTPARMERREQARISNAEIVAGTRRPPTPGQFVEGYDMGNAIEAGLVPDRKGHWASRVPAGGEEGLILKSQDHETFHMTVEGEKEAGMVWYRSATNGRWYTFPKGQKPPAGKRLYKREPVEGKDYDWTEGNPRAPRGARRSDPIPGYN